MLGQWPNIPPSFYRCLPKFYCTSITAGVGMPRMKRVGAALGARVA
jgi:hypothetical protein